MSGSANIEIGEGRDTVDDRMESQPGMTDPNASSGPSGVNESVFLESFFDLEKEFATLNTGVPGPIQIDLERMFDPPDFEKPGEFDPDYKYDPPKDVKTGIPGAIGRKIDDLFSNPITNLINVAVGFVPVLGLINSGAKVAGLPTVGEMVTQAVRGAIAGDITPYDVGYTPDRNPTGDIIDYVEPKWVDKKYRLSDGRIIVVPSYPEIKTEPVDFDPFAKKEPAVRG